MATFKSTNLCEIVLKKALECNYLQRLFSTVFTVLCSTVYRHTLLLYVQQWTDIVKENKLEGYYGIPTCCITEHPPFLRSDVLLPQLYSVYSADKLNNLKGQREGQGSLPSPTPDSLCGDYYRAL